jgi:hypothetical protein
MITSLTHSPLPEPLWKTSLVVVEAAALLRAAALLLTAAALPILAGPGPGALPGLLAGTGDPDDDWAWTFTGGALAATGVWGTVFAWPATCGVCTTTTGEATTQG